MLRVGELVPDFLLPDQDGNTVCLFDELADRHVIVTFYAKDATFG